MKKHPFFLHLLALLLVLTALFAPLAPTFTAYAAESDDIVSEPELLHSGKCGDNLTWALYSGGTLTIQGTGKMTDYAGPGAGDAPWLQYDDQIRRVVIEEGVASIGNFAFYRCYNLLSVTLPGSLTDIGELAFCYCSRLMEIQFPSKLSSIAARAFYGCSNLRDLVLPEGLISVEDTAFAHCTYLQTVELPSTVTAIRANAFSGCSELKEIRLWNGLLFIGPDAFADCKQLRRVIFAGEAEQWYDVVITSGNEYLLSVPVQFVASLDPDAQLPAESLDYRFYTTVPFTALAPDETLTLRAELYREDGTQVTAADGYTMYSIFPGIFDHQTLPDAWTFTLRSQHETYMNTIFQVAETASAASLPFYTWNGIHAFRCSDEWSPAATRSALRMDGYQCRHSQYNEHSMAFDAYNTAYSYGAAAVYDRQGALLEVVPIPAKINTGSDVIIDGVRYMEIDAVSLAVLGTQWYTAGTPYPIQLKGAPDECEILFTADGSDSAYPALFTGIDIFARWMAAEAGLSLTGEQQQTLSLALIDTALAELPPNAAVQFGKELHPFLAAGNTSRNIIFIVYNLYQSIDANARTIAGDTLTCMGFSADDLPAAPPAEESLAALLEQTPELGWPAMDYAFNLNRGSTHIFTASSSPVTLTDSTIKVTSDRNFDSATVLDAQLPTSMLGEYSALTDGITDCMLYEFRLLKDGAEYVPAEAFELPHRTLTVYLPLSQALRGGDVTVYRVEDDGTRTYISARVEKGAAVFKTDRPGTFIVGRSTRSTSPIAAVLLSVLTLAAGLGAGLLLYRKAHPKSAKQSEV